MASVSAAKFIISFTDPNLDPKSDPEDAAELERLTQSVYQEANQLLQDLDEEGEVKLVRASEVPEGSKAGAGAIIWGVLTAEVSIQNIQALLGFIGDKLNGKPIKVKVKANGREVEIEAHSRQQLLEAERIAKELLESE
ncbi:MAG: hypothetical protein F6K16_17855 [Symploca sp. SIO2B6]|nr:hypothetical protein [Symploca sp. SIO2B6]